MIEISSPWVALMRLRIVFLREFTPSSANSISGPSMPNGSTTPKGKARDLRQEAFIPENVYDAVKENKRFDSMRVSVIALFAYR